jgi:hypothetical protein
MGGFPVVQASIFSIFDQGATLLRELLVWRNPKIEIRCYGRQNAKHNVPSVVR